MPEPQQPDLSGMEPIERAPQAPTAPPAMPAYPPAPNPFMRSPLPTSQVLQPDTLRYFFRPAGPPQSRVIPQPPNATPAIGASASSQAITVVQQGQGTLLETNHVTNADQSTLDLIAGANISLVADKFGGVTVTGTSGGDGLVHGDAIWDVDSAVSFERDDFKYGGTTSGGIGETQWNAISASASIHYGTGVPGHLGELIIPNIAASNDYNSYVHPSTTVGPHGTAWALAENPGWKLVFVWRWGAQSFSSIPISFAKKSFYVGLCMFDSQLPVRPYVFIGARYDTDPGTGSPQSLTSVANASGGSTVYTGSFITGGGGNGLAGFTFVISGFTNAQNNGTFLCTASTSTTLTLSNPNGVAQSGASATANLNAISDSTMKFEVVANPLVGSTTRNNTVGSVIDTGLTPTGEKYYRLEIECVTAGTVTMSINGSTPQTLTIPKVTITDTSSGQVNATNGYAEYGFTQQTGGLSPWSNGSAVTVSGLTGSAAVLNGSQVLGLANANMNSTTILWPTTASVGVTNSAVSVTGYPALIPFFTWGNDTEASPNADTVLAMDFYAFAWNGGLAGLTPSSTISRYYNV